MDKLILHNKRTGRSYEVVRYDKKTGMIRLQGPNAEFSEKFDADTFKRMGYVLRKETQDAK